MLTSTKQGPGYVDNGRCDVGLEFKPGVCLGRHYHAKALEAKNRRNSFEPCGYCPLIIDHIKKSQQEQKTMETKEREFCTRCGTAAYLESGLCVNCREDDKQTQKATKAPAKGKPGQKAACIECKLVKKIATSGICWGCYRKPEIKKKYGIQGNGRPKKPAPKTGAGEKKIDLPGVGTCPPPVELPPVVIKPKSGGILPPVDMLGQPIVPPNKKYWHQVNPKLYEFVREKKIDLAELKRQASEQEKLLKLKYFEISTTERFLQDLEQAIKGV